MVGAVLLSVISNILNLTSIISVYLNAAVQGFVIIVVAFLQRGGAEAVSLPPAFHFIQPQQETQHEHH